MKNNLLLPFQVLGVFIVFKSIIYYAPSLTFIFNAEDAQIEKYFGGFLLTALGLVAAGLILVFSGRFMNLFAGYQAGPKYLVYSGSAVMIAGAYTNDILLESIMIVNYLYMPVQLDYNFYFTGAKYSLISLVMMILMYLAWKDLEPVEEGFISEPLDQEGPS